MNLPFASMALRWSVQNLPFASRQTLKIPRGSFDQAPWPQAFVVRAIKLAVCLHSHSSLLFARLHMPKIPRGSFDQALWRQAFVVRAFKPAVCLHGPLLLGHSSLPFARLQTLKIRGSFDQALWRQAFVVRTLPFASSIALLLRGEMWCFGNPLFSSTNLGFHLKPCEFVEHGGTKYVTRLP